MQVDLRVLDVRCTPNMVDSEIDTVDQIKPKDEDTVIIRLLNLYLQKLFIVVFGHFKVAYAMTSLIVPW